MMITPHNIFDYRDRQINAKNGYITFRLYEDGWLVRYTPFTGQPVTIEGQDVFSACAFANQRLS